MAWGFAASCQSLRLAKRMGQTREGNKKEKKTIVKKKKRVNSGAGFQ
jgi:hypothetical protein